MAANAALIFPSRSSQAGWRSVWTRPTPVSLWVLGGTLVALVAIASVPWLTKVFGFQALSVAQWCLVLALGLALLLVQEAIKWCVLRGAPRRSAKFNPGGA